MAIDAKGQIRLERLEFMVTYRCSSRCDHCSVFSEARRDAPDHLEIEKAEEIINASCDAFPVRSLMAFGGEPLIYPEYACALFRLASKRGVETRQIITNGYWSRDKKRIDDIAMMLADSGVNDILVSIDCFHEKYLDYSMVEYSLEGLKTSVPARLQLHPVWVRGKEDDNAYNEKTKEVLARFAEADVPEGPGNALFPAGRALTNLADYLPAKTTSFTGTCKDQPYADPPNDVRTLCIEPDGSVVACGAIGNINGQSMEEILARYDFRKNIVHAAMVEKGSQGLYSLARENGIALRADGYFSLCELCNDLSAKLSGAMGKNALSDIA